MELSNGGKVVERSFPVIPIEPDAQKGKLYHPNSKNKKRNFPTGIQIFKTLPPTLSQISVAIQREKLRRLGVKHDIMRGRIETEVREEFSRDL